VDNVFALDVVKRGAFLPHGLRRLDVGFKGRNLQHPVGREDHCALNEILEFTDVAWPRMIDHRSHGGRRNIRRRPSYTLGSFLHEMAYKRWNVLAPLS